MIRPPATPTTAGLAPAWLWHDLECGAYRADLALWRRLTRGSPGPVLDIGAGTGRVALDLAGSGREVVALDRDPELLEALRERAGDLSVEVVCADAREFELPRSFPLILAPMQTVQLLGGAGGRSAFLARARAHLEPGGRVACAIVGELVPFDLTDSPPPADVRELAGTIYSSRPVAIRRVGARMALERVRETLTADGERRAQRDVVELDILTAAQLVDEAAGHDLHAERTRRIAATHEHVASQVVVLRG